MKTTLHTDLRTLQVILLIFILNIVLISCEIGNGRGLEASMSHVRELDLSQHPSSPPEKPIHLLFIHHSTGGQLLADIGSVNGKDCIFATHPYGGGLKSLLEKNNYIVHEASYNSLIGDKTDICHWNTKFRDHMNEILTCMNQDEYLPDNTRNGIIIFKSCFPNNWIESDGKNPGDPDSCVRTLANVKAAYKALLVYFSQQPDTLFIAMTAPPLVEPILYRKGKVVELLKMTLDRPDTIDKVGKRAREFNNWLIDVESGWLKDYRLKNVVVFDYYDVLTGYGQSNWTLYPTEDGTDSHPNSNGNNKAAQDFIPFINRAVHRMGLIQ